MYSQTGFPDDEESLGYPINVYQETINKVFREYLVNFDYFIQIMDDYGFVLISKEEAHKMNLPNGSGLFSELFSNMQNECKRHPENAKNYGQSLQMSEEERKISFMNRYFIFKKMRSVNTDKMQKILEKYQDSVEKSMEEYEEEHDAIKLSKSLLDADSIVVEPKGTEEGNVVKPKRTKKINKKFTIEHFSPIIDTPEGQIKMGTETIMFTPAKRH